MSFYTAVRGSVLSSDPGDYPEGIIIPVNKPYRWTSADVIRKIKYAAVRHFAKKNLKVGHAGTLDPLACGVLLVCIGNATKMAEELQKHDKEYVAEICFGASTPSYDMEKEIDCIYPCHHIGRENLIEALEKFIGEQEQTAPLFSAKSVGGKRAYEIARAMQTDNSGTKMLEIEADAKLKKQNIFIYETELLSFTDCPDLKNTGIQKARTDKKDEKNPDERINVSDLSGYDLSMAKIRIRCSKGTYIRAFARDLGEVLHSGAFLSGLTRTKTGTFTVEEALSVEEALHILP